MRGVFTLAFVLVLLPTALWLGGTGYLTAESPQDTPYDASAGYRLALPVLNVGNGWTTTLHIQNVGDGPTAARVAFFGTVAGNCQVADPLAVRCVGAIAPGAAWTLALDDAEELAGVTAALVTSVAAGVDACGDQPLPMGEPLAVVVQRTRVGESGMVAAGAYTGIAPAVAGFWDPERQAYVTLIPWLETDAGRDTMLALQNIGAECARGIELELWRSGECGLPAFPEPITLPDLPAGTAVHVWLGERIEDDFAGWAWLRSPQPLAVVVDRWQNGVTLLSTHAAGRSAAAPHLDAPLVFADSQGWNTTLRVQNASTRGAAFLEVRYRDPGGQVVAEHAQPVCPGGTAVQKVTEVDGLTTPFLGSALLASAEMEQPELPRLTAVTELLSAADERAAVYHVPNAISGDGQAVDVALPWLVRNFAASTAGMVITHTSRIAIVNQNREPGEGQVILSLYDADGLVSAYQPPSTLGPGGMLLIDLAEVPGLVDGWQGSGRVRLLSTQPGPPAVAVVVLDAPLGNGDPAAAYAGIAATVQVQPTPTPSPTVTPTPTPTATPTVSPSPAPPGPEHRQYLPLVRR